MASLLAKGPPVTRSKEAEILACRRAVEFTVEFGFSELVVEEILAISIGTHLPGRNLSSQWPTVVAG